MRGRESARGWKLDVRSARRRLRIIASA